MKKIWIYWSLSLLLFAACIIVNLLFFRVREMLPLEFAPSADAMHTYIMHIGSSLAHNYYILKMNTITDYVFLTAYTLLTFFSFKILLNVFQAPAGTWVYIISIIPGLLDAVENIFLMITAIRQREAFSCLYYYVVRIKWAFAIVPFMLIPIIMLYGLIVLFRAKQTD